MTPLQTSLCLRIFFFFCSHVPSDTRVYPHSVNQGKCHSRPFFASCLPHASRRRLHRIVHERDRFFEAANHMLAEGVCTASCMRCRERNLAVLHGQLSLAHWPRRALSYTTKHCARSAIADNSPPGLKARPHANRAGVLVPSDDITLVTGATRWRATQAKIKKIDVAKYGNLHNHHRWRQSTTVGDRALFLNFRSP